MNDSLEIVEKQHIQSVKKYLLEQYRIFLVLKNPEIFNELIQNLEKFDGN